MAVPSPSPTSSVEFEWEEVPERSSKKREKPCSFAFFEVVYQEVPKVLRPVIEGPMSYVEMGPLIGLARPGYPEFILSDVLSESERKEIDDNLIYLKKKGVVVLVSLSSAERHDSHDFYIEERWRLLNEDRPVLFEYIPNEDAVGYKLGKFPKGAGPSVEKFKRVADLVNRYTSDVSKIALYCGAGKGRTCSYLASHLVLRCNLPVFESINLVIKGMDHLCEGEEASARYEISQNFGESCLVELSEEVNLRKVLFSSK